MGSPFVNDYEAVVIIRTFPSDLLHIHPETKTISKNGCFSFLFYPVPEPQSDSGCQELQGHTSTGASSGNLALPFGVISDSITLDQLGPAPAVFIES